MVSKCAQTIQIYRTNSSTAAPKTIHSLQLAPFLMWLLKTKTQNEVGSVNICVNALFIFYFFK
jgi:hypothetical protein